MRVNVTKITNIDLLRWACSMTIDAESNASLDGIYRNEHSPLRTQIFQVELIDIPTFVSTHFVRHATVGQLHFVKTQRDDRGGDADSDRWTPTRHGMILNAQHLIDMSRKRLCRKSHTSTITVMEELKHEISLIDPCLARYMVPECVYRGGCHEDKPCGFYKEV